jgi:hypothetical protein
MFNAYALIIGLFILTGIVTTAWGIRIILRGRKTLAWPGTDGVIEKSAAVAEADDLLPDIRYYYTVNNQTLHATLTFPGGTTPTRELSDSYAKKYPEGRKVTVYYNPQRPQHSTLEPGPANGDWLISFIGVTMIGLGCLMFIF